MSVSTKFLADTATLLKTAIKSKFLGTGTNEVSGTSEFLPLEPPVRVTGAGKSSLGEIRQS